MAKHKNVLHHSEIPTEALPAPEGSLFGLLEHL